MSVVAARKVYQKLTLMVPMITMNSPTKPLVPGRPTLPMVKSMKVAAYHGMRVTSPP